MAAIPRPASTIALMDQANRVYLTKRPKTMKFMGGFYVFPGGAVENSDLPSGNHLIKSENCDYSFDIRHYVAAARELFEEVGVLLCETKDGSPVHITEERKREYRHQLIEGSITLEQILEREGILLDLEDITYFGHLITPEIVPIRFDTRFFLARIPMGQFPEPDHNEIADAYWISPDEALENYEAGKIPLAPPTAYALQTISNFLKGDPLIMPKVRGEELFNRLKFQ